MKISIADFSLQLGEEIDTQSLSVFCYQCSKKWRGIDQKIISFDGSEDLLDLEVIRDEELQLFPEAITSKCLPSRIYVSPMNIVHCPHCGHHLSVIRST